MNDAARSGPILAADIGGTHVRFSIVGASVAEPLIAATTRHYDCAKFSSFSDALRRYLDEVRVGPASAVISAAGLRTGDEVRLTNLSWTISARALESEFGFARTTLINDFVAMAFCVPLLGASDLLVLGDPQPQSIDSTASKTFALVGPGTGLGVGALLLRDGRFLALETEGGHTSFAPGDDKEIAILQHLTVRFGRVSNERLLCGSGLLNLYEAICELKGTRARMSKPEDITAHADADADCADAVERFCEILGALAGDLALVFGAWDGVYLTGGMVEPLARRIAGGGFRRRFENKGRFAVAVSRVPASIVLRADAGLLGAGAFALAQSGRSLFRANA